MLDPFVLDLFMDQPYPSEEIIQIEGMMVQNIIEQISQLQNIQGAYADAKSSEKTQLPEQSYIEKYIQDCTDEEYEKTFCMERSTMEKLVECIAAKMDEKGVNVEGMKIPLDKKLHIFIWILTHKLSYRKCGNFFNIDKSSVSNIFHQICDILIELRQDFIKWPNFDEQDMIKEEVRNKYSIPNCVGFIDVCDIHIKGQKESYTVALQAVCDHNLIFRDIYLGQSGRPAQIFKKNPLSKEINCLIQEENHLLGDSSYRLNPRLMTPFKNKNLINMQDNYNKIHLETCSYIKKAFASLTNKFKRLKHLELNNIAEAKTIICAACVLHNFILYNEITDSNKELVVNDAILEFSELNAIEKRHLLCSMLSQ